MKTIKFIAAIMMVAVMATNSNAQSARTPVEQKAKQLQTDLKLTDLQTTKVTVILQQILKDQENDKAAQANMKSWQAAHNTKAMIGYILKQMNENASRIEQVLTPEQKKAYEEKLEKRRDGLSKLAAAQK